MAPSITCQLVPENERIQHTAALFGNHFPLKLEPFVFFMAGTLAEDYNGGFWNFYALSNGGFYMAPSSGASFHVCCENGFNGNLGADAFGITCMLYSYSHLSFGNGEFAQTCAEQYHLLREYMYGHDEVDAILRAID